jgi:hypothetical protein
VVVLDLLLIATFLAGCGSLAPVASAPPTFTQEPAAATPPAPTPTSTPGVIRVRWMYLPDRVALVLQEDGHTGVMEAARLRAPNGTVLASGSSHRATPGEPRTCGHPDVVPPFVVTLRVEPDIADRLKAGDPRYVLEVEEDGFGWYPRELLDWTILASPPCFSE